MALAKMKLQSDTQFSLVTTLHEEFVVWGYKVLTFIRGSISGCSGRCRREYSVLLYTAGKVLSCGTNVASCRLAKSY
jgi:hypothetical protein